MGCPGRGMGGKKKEEKTQNTTQKNKGCPMPQPASSPCEERGSLEDYPPLLPPRAFPSAPSTAGLLLPLLLPTATHAPRGVLTQALLLA